MVWAAFRGSAGARRRAARQVRHVQSLLDEVSRTDSELTFAQISGRDSTEAAARRAVAIRHSMPPPQRSPRAARRSPKKSPLATRLKRFQKQLQRKFRCARHVCLDRGIRIRALGSRRCRRTVSGDRPMRRSTTKAPRCAQVCEELRGLSRFGLVEQGLPAPDPAAFQSSTGMRQYGFAVGGE